MEEEGDKSGQARDSGAETAAAGEEGGEEGKGFEEEGDEYEDPAEAPDVVVVVGGGVPAVAADEGRRSLGRMAAPGLAEGRGRASGTAVAVALAAEEEVGPLGDAAGASDVGGVRAEEVDVV